MAVDRDKVLQAAQKLVEKKRYDKAAVEYQKILAEEPNDVRTLLKLGDLFLKMEQHVDAITTYERVGQHYSTQGFAVKAVAVYKQIREIIQKQVPHLEDRFGHIVPRLAEIFAELGLTSDAFSAYDEVATRYQKAGRDRDAIDVFRKVVDLDPSNPVPYLRLAEAYVRVRDVDNAIQRFGTGAEILLKLGRRDDALKVVERLLQHRAEARFARMAAEIYLDRGQPNDGMAALTKLQISFKENPKDLDTLALLARAFDKLGQPAKANEVQKEAARIAKEAGKLDAYNALVDGLLARAPDDETVRLLASQRNAVSLVPPAPSGPVAPRGEPVIHKAPDGHDPRASIDVEVDEDVDLDAGEPDSAAPFHLRASHPGLPPAALDPVARARQILSQAEAARRNKDYDAAVAFLIEGVDELPAARELREKLCDTLMEAGDQPEAIRQLLGFARWLAGTGDVDGAARLLDEVLLIEPSQPDAIAMLRELGYSVPTSTYPPAEGYDEGEVAAPEAHAGPHYDPNAPLPSYDLEEVGPDQVLSRRGSPGGPPLETSQLDDPFAGDMPLPSFPMDEEATQFIQSPLARAPVVTAPEPPTSPHAPRYSAPPPEGAPQQLDEEALEEVEFFSTHGMFDEARALLGEQLERLPNHPLLLERLREVEAMAGGGSGPRAVPRGSAPPEEDRSFDIAASLDALDALDAGAPASYHSDEPHQVSVESVFEQFKAGVAAQISESDAATHYDLGVAYKEMGLYTDAISEFELASRDPGRECVCHSMVGMIWLQMGNAEPAIDAFLRGLHALQKTPDQEMALTYEIGNTYELVGDGHHALLYFQRLGRVEPTYYDPRGGITERVRALEPHHEKPARAVGAEHASDDFDAALDELLGGGKPN